MYICRMCSVTFEIVVSLKSHSLQLTAGQMIFRFWPLEECYVTKSALKVVFFWCGSLRLFLLQMLQYNNCIEDYEYSQHEFSVIPKSFANRFSRKTDCPQMNSFASLHFKQNLELNTICSFNFGPVFAIKSQRKHSMLSFSFTWLPLI